MLKPQRERARASESENGREWAGLWSVYGESKSIAQGANESGGFRRLPSDPIGRDLWDLGIKESTSVNWTSDNWWMIWLVGWVEPLHCCSRHVYSTNIVSLIPATAITCTFVATKEGGYIEDGRKLSWFGQPEWHEICAQKIPRWSRGNASCFVTLFICT